MRIPGIAISWTRLGLLAAITIASTHSVSAMNEAIVKGPEFAWRTLRVGGGGWLTGIDMSSDGLVKLVRADTYGAYIWNEERQEWRQLVTADSIPAADWRHADAGVYEIRVAPSLNRRLYMALAGYIYRSDDSGEHWARTSFPNTPMDANGDFRTNGQKMAVDPANPDIVYAGSPQGGLWSTQDGGQSWRKVADVPSGAQASNNNYPGIAGIVFDPRSELIDGRTKTIYAASYGHGVFRTNDGGTSWTALDGGPRDVSHARIAEDGAYYAVGDDGSAVWRLDGSGWINITPGGGGAHQKGVWSTVVTDPRDPARVLAVRGYGALAASLDRGETWRDPGNAARLTRVSRDVPWLAWTNESWMSVGDIAFDPSKRDEIWFAEGIGVWRATFRGDGADQSSIVFHSRTAGIEQLVANQILSPPGDRPILASWDRPVFRVEDPDVYPTRHGPDNSNAIVMGWSVDYSADTPGYVAGLFNWGNVEKSGFSRDGGRTWSPFLSYPPLTSQGKIGGSLAVSTPSNLIWAPSNNGNSYYTLDGGANWSEVDISGVPHEGATGWGFGYWLNRHIVAADRVTPNRFYLYNDPRGLYRTTDGGVSWTLAHRGEIVPFSGFSGELRSVPGHAGHLLFTAGAQSAPDGAHPTPSPFMGSVDGGATWKQVRAALEVFAFGFGKGRGDYPDIYIAGWVRGEFGLWRSQDATNSWTKIGRFPVGILDQVTTIEGDADIPGRVYVGFKGAGFAIGEERPEASPNRNKDAAPAKISN